MSYFSNITNAVGTLIEGMKVTMGYFVRPREHVTLQYPDEVWPVPERNIGVGELDAYNTIRSKLVVDMNDCIGCKACERACPVKCITIDTYKAGPDTDLGETSNGTKKKLLVANFTIDMSECMFCDLCTPPCPEDCIIMTPDYQFISNDNLKTDVTPEQRWRDRDLLIYQFSKVPEDERQKLKAEAEEVAQAKALAMAAKKAAAEKAASEKAAAEKAASGEAALKAQEATVEVQEDSPEAVETSTETIEEAPAVEEASTPVEAVAEEAPQELTGEDETQAEASETPGETQGETVKPDTTEESDDSVEKERENG